MSQSSESGQVWETPDFGESQDLATATGTATSRRRAKGTIPPKLYRIGEVVEYAGVSRQTIHNYTTMGLIREADWTRGGHRLYDESVFLRLDQIADMKARDRSMEHIRKHFEKIDAATDG